MVSDLRVEVLGWIHRTSYFVSLEISTLWCYKIVLLILISIGLICRKCVCKSFFLNLHWRFNVSYIGGFVFVIFEIRRRHAQWPRTDKTRKLKIATHCKRPDVCRLGLFERRFIVTSGRLFCVINQVVHLQTLKLEFLTLS